MDENTPISVWPLDFVIDINVGRARWARSVRLKTKSLEVVRPLMMIIFFKAFGEDRREIKNEILYFNLPS